VRRWKILHNKFNFGGRSEVEIREGRGKERGERWVREGGGPFVPSSGSEGRDHHFFLMPPLLDVAVEVAVEDD
jgi:hypothetical protein